MTDALNPKHGNLGTYQFSVANPDTSATNIDIPLAGTLAANTLEKMPAAGSVVGISVKNNADVTAGTITFHAHKASTEWPDASALAVQLTSGSTLKRGSSGTVRPGVMTFAAGDDIGVSYSTSASYAPTTDDYDVELMVEFDPEP